MGGPPPEFPLAFTNPGIVRHLSGLSVQALTRLAYTSGGHCTPPLKAEGFTPFTFISRSYFFRKLELHSHVRWTPWSVLQDGTFLSVKSITKKQLQVKTPRLSSCQITPKGPRTQHKPKCLIPWRTKRFTPNSRASFVITQTKRLGTAKNCLNGPQVLSPGKA